MNNKLTVIIPIHILEEYEFTLLTHAINSLNNQKSTNFKVIFVVSEQVETQKLKIQELCKFEHIFELNSESDSYQQQINHAVLNVVDTEYFTVLQFDDAALPNWIARLETYIEQHPEDGVLMGLPHENLMKTDGTLEFMGYANRIAWQKSSNFGYIEMEALKEAVRATNIVASVAGFSLAGAAYKTEMFVRAGGLKKGQEYFFDYEFLMRIKQLGYKIYVIPKTMYISVFGRKGSITDDMQAMDKGERYKWLMMANSEYLFTYDRMLIPTEDTVTTTEK